MPKFVCPFGHTEADPHNPGKMRPLVHVSRNRCAIYRQLRAEGKVDLWGRLLPGKALTKSADSTPAPETTADAGGDKGSAPGSSPAPEAPKAPEKPSLGQRLASGLGVKYKTVGTTGPGTPGMEPEATAWEVSPETSSRFWSTIIGFIGTLFNLLTGWLEIPPVPKEVFEVDAGQDFVFRTAFKGLTTNILIKVFRAKSPEEADQIVAGLTGFLGFGMMAMKIALHMIVHVPKSPKLAGWRKKREEAKAERARIKQLRDAEKAAAGGARPAGA